ncbi:Asp-tRNA(Asn)/Glu-tRNA(Gln) amidotransferase GatCAB subunit C [archaeon CG10_big_fil_rev_8_21_14_0_10_43_11]|nr:MAG: Asp-tRNA(Asn)/Glu-tRNA(Gln) amidotransferase GatCAB subunit C [archaeon CG10_big_fil_rev_8_21_14_0_10_43_11]
MSRVTKETVKKVASIARIKLSDEELVRFSNDFSDVLDAFSKLDELDVEGTVASFHPVRIANVFREDTPKKSLTPAQALSNTTQKEDSMFKTGSIA